MPCLQSFVSIAAFANEGLTFTRAPFSATKPWKMECIKQRLHKVKKKRERREEDDIMGFVKNIKVMDGVTRMLKVAFK